MGQDIRKTVFVVPHTHWDREWYEPFQVFRARLVQVMDHAMDVLNDRSQFRRFTLDGQAAVLEDYLEVRPERRERLEELVRAGRLLIGPWYVLADEFLVSPESLIRNLSLGRRVCRQFGPVMNVAYTPDPFGHIAQLPRILAGFGLETVIFQRGVGDEVERLGVEFVWEADDDTSVLAVQLPATYSAVAGLGHRAWNYEEGGAFDVEAAARQVRAILFGSEQPPQELPFWLQLPFERLKDGGLAGRSRAAALLLLNGSDHLFMQEDLPELLEELAAAVPEVEWVLGDLEEYVAGLRVSYSGLERYRGEFRGSRYHHILSGVLSTRNYLKQANDRAQQLLERYAEPLSALAGAGGHRGLLTEGWKLLLKNHAHDSICGCSADAVHREMMTRYEGVGQIGDYTAAASLRRLVGARAAADGEPGAEAAVAVFNPLPYSSASVVHYTLDVPEGAGDRLAVVDGGGSPLPVQIEVEKVWAPGRSDVQLDRATLSFAPTLPPLGVAVAHIVPDGSRMTPAEGDVEVEARALQNEHLRLEFGPAGPVLVERATGRHHGLRLRFENTADAGDSYDYSPLADGRALVWENPAGEPRIVRSGPVTGALGVVYRLELPQRLSFDRKRRVGRTEMDVEVVFCLERGSRALHMSINAWNDAEDHRLRLVLASGIDTDHVLAGDSFQVTRRPVRPPTGDGWYQKPQPTAPMRHFVAVEEEARGLAVMARGLHEYEAVPGPQGVDLAVTLLRSVGWLSRDDLLSRPEGAGPSVPVPEAQCPGAHSFELAVMPYEGSYWDGPFLQELDAFVAPPLAVAVDAAARGSAAGFLELSPPFVMSALKAADEGDGLVVRFWNPAPVPVDGWLRIEGGSRELHEIRLDETRLREEPVRTDDGGRVSIRMSPGEVRTYEVVGFRTLATKGGGRLPAAE